jgi:hypothetical protein
MLWSELLLLVGREARVAGAIIGQAFDISTASAAAICCRWSGAAVGYRWSMLDALRVFDQAFGEFEFFLGAFVGQAWTGDRRWRKC